MCIRDRMKISPDMLPVMVASVDMDGMDVKEISAFADETVRPAFERIDGVATVSYTHLDVDKRQPMGPAERSGGHRRATSRAFSTCSARGFPSAPRRP